MADNLINTSDLVEKALDKPQEGGFDTPDQPNSESVERFEDLVSAKTDAPEVAPTDLPPVNETKPVEAPALTLGDKILQGMQGLRDQVEMKSDMVKASLGPGETLNMKEMFQTQMAMTNLMVTEDYIGKIVSKSTQTFDTLLRNQ